MADGWVTHYNGRRLWCGKTAISLVRAVSWFTLAAWAVYCVLTVSFSDPLVPFSASAWLWVTSDLRTLHRIISTAAEGSDA